MKRYKTGSAPNSLAEKATDDVSNPEEAPIRVVISMDRHGTSPCPTLISSILGRTGRKIEARIYTRHGHRFRTTPHYPPGMKEREAACVGSSQNKQSQSLLFHHCAAGLRAARRQHLLLGKEQPPQDSNLERRNQNP